MSKTVLFLDGNNLAIRTLFANKEMINNPNPDFALHKHLFLAAIFSNIKKFEPQEVIIAIDDKKCWRKSVYPEYKANRKEQRDKDVFPWDQYYAYIDEFLQQIKDLFPFKLIKIPYAEADDVIAVLSKHLVKDDVIIVTSDSDYIQLLRWNHIKLWDPFKNEYIKNENPYNTMMIKILSGDSSDHIPNIKPKVGPKTAEKLLASGELQKFIDENQLHGNYIRNMRLIDWDNIPDVMKKKILEVFDNYPPSKNINKNDMFMFFVKNHLRKMSEDAQEIGFLLDKMFKERNEFFG